MKKILSRSGFGAVAVALLLTSCVSKKKYVEAQNTIEKYRSDSAQMAQQAASMQQNISSLEEKNKTMQAQWDSSKALAQAEIQRWNGLQTYYDQQKTSITGLHQQLHDALNGSEVINADDITASNGRVYVTLDDQVFSGGQLSTKGKKAIADFANVIKDKEDMVVDVASGDSYAAFWNKGTGAEGMAGNDASAAAGNDANAAANDNSAVSGNNDATATARTKATYRRPSSATARKSSTATRSSRATASRSTAKKKTYRSESGRSMSFKSKSKSSKSNSWNSNIAKATAIAKELHKNGVYNVGMLVPGSANAAAPSGKTNFQLIVSPKGDRYYEMIESSSPSKDANGTNNQPASGAQPTGTGGNQ